MTGLDINTPKGQITLAEEKAAIAIFKAHYPQSTYVHTPKESKAVIDGVIIKQDQLLGVVETRCRKMGLAEFETRFDSLWLITYDKLLGGRRVADDMQLPFWGFLYLVPSSLLLVQRLYEPSSGWLVQFDKKRTVTQATVNGGTANRENAFVDMTRALQLRPL